MSLPPPRMRMLQEGPLTAYPPSGTLMASPELTVSGYSVRESPSRKRKSTSTSTRSNAIPSEAKVRRPPNCIYNRNMVQQPQHEFRRRRTTEDFLTFCKMILDYENYTDQDDVRKRHSSSPLGSTGSSAGSWESNTNKEDHMHSKAPNLEDSAVDTDDKEGWDDVTCYCKKPFAGRPMIECTNCLTWVHLKCAKLNRNRIPEHWFCHRCRPRQKANKSKASPNPPSNKAAKISGSRKRKSSITTKRVVQEQESDTEEPKTEAKTEEQVSRS